jgi:hypothetical protein
MANFERLSNRVLIRTCSCGIVFETYDPKKMYHSNKCRQIYVSKKCEAMIMQKRKLNQKKLKERALSEKEKETIFF